MTTNPNRFDSTAESLKPRESISRSRLTLHLAMSAARPFPRLAASSDAHPRPPPRMHPFPSIKHPASPPACGRLIQSEDRSVQHRGEGHPSGVAGKQPRRHTVLAPRCGNEGKYDGYSRCARIRIQSSALRHTGSHRQRPKVGFSVPEQGARTQYAQGFCRKLVRADER